MSQSPVPHPSFASMPATEDDRRWMDFIIGVLHGWSKHRGTKHGSVITGPEGQFLSLGFNGLDRNTDDANPAFGQHPLKRQLTMCAERNAMRNARAAGIDVTGATLHADAEPCQACQAEIVASGIGTVVYVRTKVPSASHGDDHWGSGVDTLTEVGITLRWHDPSTKNYDAATIKHRHPPIPSGTADWDSRFLAMADYLERWQPSGTGEVLARRPVNPDEPDDKIVRSLGYWSPAPSPSIFDALQNARIAGVSLRDCTLYLSRGDRLADLQPILDSGLHQIVLPQHCADNPVLAAALPLLDQKGIGIRFHEPTPQDYNSLVAKVYGNPPLSNGKDMSLTLK